MLGSSQPNAAKARRIADARYAVRMVWPRDKRKTCEQWIKEGKGVDCNRSRQFLVICGMSVTNICYARSRSGAIEFM